MKTESHGDRSVVALRAPAMWAFKVSRTCLAALIGACCIIGSASAQPAVTIQPPNLAGAIAGSLDGSAGVSASGASTYTIRLAVPPGTAGLVPSLTLNYSSQVGRGLLGHGWSIGGLSAITRCAKTMAQDSVSGAVTLTSSDQFCADGQRLLLVSGTHGASAEYRTQVETFGKFLSTGSDTAKGPDSWQVYVKGGLILTYGGTIDSTVKAAGKAQVLTWALSRVQDRRGNYYDVKYTQINATDAGSAPVPTIEYFPSQIRYTGNTVTGLISYNAVNFVYETRPDLWTGYVAATGLRATQRLTALRTVVNTAADGTGGTLVRDYRVAYTTNANNGRSLVNTITDCDGTGICLSPTTFTWSTADPAANTFSAAGSGDWGGPSVAFLPYSATNGTQDQQVQSQVLMGDLNGDGALDLFSSDGTGNWKVCLGGSNTFTCQNWAGPAVSSKSALYGDFNGDGRTDIAIPPAAGSTAWNVCLSTGTGFSCSTWTAPSMGPYPNLYLVGDFSGDGRDDVILVDRHNTNGGSRLCKSLGNAFEACVAYDVSGYIQATMNDPESGPRLRGRLTGDFNGDGRTDIMIDTAGGTSGQDTYVATDTGLLPAGSTAGGPLAVTVGANHSADQNGDPYGSYGDVIPLTSSRTAALVCRSTGPAFVCDPIAGTDSTTSLVFHVGDADGDGRPDLYVGGGADTKVCQLGQSAPYLLGATYGSTVGSNTVNVTCASWPTQYPPSPSISSYFGDFNGDGRIDRAYYVAATNSWNIQLAGNGGYADLLASVVNGVGHETQFTYKGTNDASVYTRGADVAYPKRNVADASPVVSERREANALGGWLKSDYSYQGQRTDVRGLGSLGFEKTTAVDQTNGITTVTTNSQDFPFIGMPTQVKSVQANGTVLSQADYTMASFATAGGALLPYVSTGLVTKKDLNNAPLPTVATLVNTGGIDAYGNVTSATETITSPDGDVFTTTTTNIYDNLTANWLIGLLRKTTVSKTAQQTGASATTPPALSLSGCSSVTPTNVPAMAKMTCTLGNSGQSVASSIAYGTPAGTTASGPTNCAANNLSCGVVTVTTGATVGTYSGTLTATSTPAGGTASVGVSLVVNPPSVAFIPTSINWGTIGAASDSGDWPQIKNNSTVAVLITAHTTVSGPTGMWSWQGAAGNCIPGTTVLQPATSCSTFFGTGALSTPGAYSATDRISFQVVGGSGATYTVQQAYTFSVATTTANSGGLTYSNVPVNTTSAGQSFTVTNNAVNGGLLKNLSISMVGAQPGSFPMTNTCGTSLAQGASCTVTVSFNPTSISSGFSASVQIQGGYSRMQGGVDSGNPPSAGVNFSVPVSGNVQGSVATLTSASTLVVVATWYGAAAQTVTANYRNDGNSPMTLNSPVPAAPLSIAANNCTAVAAGASCSIVFSAATNVPGINQSQSFAPTGANVAPAATTVTWTTQSAVPRWSATSLTFPNVAVGSSSSQNITLYNDGNTAYNWAANNAIANQPAGYSFDTSGCSSVAASGGSCLVIVTFSPSAGVSYPGSGISMSAASYGTNSFSVSGTGFTLPIVVASTGTIASTTTAPTPASGPVTFTNNGQTATTLTLSVSGGASLSTGTLNCPASGSCGSVTVTSPAGMGTYNGTLSMTSSAGGSVPAVTVNLAVIGSIATLTSAPILAVPATWYGAAAQSVTATYKNDGSGPMTLNSPAPAAPLSVSINNCSAVAPGASCRIVISVATNVPGINQSQALTPTGANVAPPPTTVTWTTQTAVPRWAPASLNFNSVAVSVSASQPITLYNDGNVAYDWAANNTIANPPAGYAFNTSACSSVAPAGGSCNVVVTFSPTTPTSYSGGGISMSAASFNTNTFSVTGTGYYPPSIFTSPTAVTATTQGSAAASSRVAFGNTSAIAATLTVSVTGGLSLSGTTLTCQAAPGPCGSVIVSSPAVPGTYTGTVSAVSSPPSNIPSVPVTFTVNAAPPSTTITASPTTLIFTSIAQGASSPYKSITVSNTGSAAAVLNWTLISTGGSPLQGDYITSGTCTNGGQLASGGGSCTMDVRYVAACNPGDRYVTLSIYGSNFTTVNVPLIATTGTNKTTSCS